MVKPLVFLFLGKDVYSKERAIRELTLSLGSSTQQFDYKMFYGQEAEIDEILGCLTTIPFLASRRIVVIKNCEKLSEEAKARLAKYITKPSKSSCLILESGDDSAAEDYRPLAEYVDIKNFSGPKEADFASWIRQFLSSRNKEIDARALEDLREGRGQDLLALSQELEKLAAFAGERKTINSRDVESVAGKPIAASAFELAGAIDKGDLAGAVKIVSGLTATGKKHYEIIGLLCWHLRRMLKAKMLSAKGETDSNIAGCLRIGMRYRDEFFRQLRAVSLPKIKSRMNMLLEADLDIKRTKFDPGLVLEFAVIRLCVS